MNGAEPPLKEHQMKRKPKKTIKAWAVVKNGKIVRDKGMMDLIVTSSKWKADSLTWKPGEKIAPITITIG